MKRLKPETLYEELLEAALKLFDDVRRDEGFFQSGACTFQGKSVLIINSRHTLQERIDALAGEIARQGSDKHFLKPAVRAEVDRQLLKFEEQTTLQEA